MLCTNKTSYNIRFLNVSSNGYKSRNQKKYLWKSTYYSRKTLVLSIIPEKQLLMSFEVAIKQQNIWFFTKVCLGSKKKTFNFLDISNFEFRG